jgi:hypothetical protein
MCLSVGKNQLQWFARQRFLLESLFFAPKVPAALSSSQVSHSVQKKWLGYCNRRFGPNVQHVGALCSLWVLRLRLGLSGLVRVDRLLTGAGQPLLVGCFRFLPVSLLVGAMVIYN